MTNKEKFLALVSKEETKTVERAKARLANKKYSKLSNQIAFEILERLDVLNWKQVRLAEEMKVSPQQVNKWVKGNENFTLETLVKLSAVLGIELIQVASKQSANKVEEVTIISSQEYTPATSIKMPKPHIILKDTTMYENQYATA